MDSLRVCNSCNRELSISEFYSPASGIRYNCKKCEIAYSRHYHETHPECSKKSDKACTKKNPRRRWATACSAGHRRRGFSIEMSAYDLYQMALRTDFCFYLWMQKKLDWQLQNKGRIKKDSPSLDTLDNERVIRADNVTILCYNCNATKRERALEEFLACCSTFVARFHSHFEYPQLPQE
jgi:hypothetical protein